MPEWMTWLLVALAALNLVLMVLVLMRPRGAEGLREALRDDAERESRELRAEVQDSARGTRQELSQALALFQQTLLTQQGDVARTQNEQIDSFRTQLAAMQQLVAQSLQQATQSLAQQSQAARDAQDAALKRFAEGQGEQIKAAHDPKAAADTNKQEAWREGPVEARLSHALVKGIDTYIEADTEEARAKLKSLEAAV